MNLKKIGALGLTAALCASLMVPAALATEADSSAAGQTKETSQAEQLHQLGLFQGVGDNADGTPNYALDSTVTRAQAVVMLVRVIGAGEDITAAKDHPFTDMTSVESWAGDQISYAYEQGLTSGVDTDRFAPNTQATTAMYVTFMLRALGYTSSGDTPDFSWSSPWAFAVKAGVFPAQVGFNSAEGASLTREELVNITVAALFSPLKGSDTLLWEQLAEQGAFTKEAFQAAFPTDPYSVLHKNLAYSADLAEVIESAADFTSVWEGEGYTLVERIQTGLPHGHSLDQLILIDKDNTQSQGYLILPDQKIEEGKSAAPASVSISGNTLTYTYNLTEDLKEGTTVTRPAGTYTYTVNLTTGTYTDSYTPEAFSFSNSGNSSH